MENESIVVLELVSICFGQNRYIGAGVVALGLGSLVFASPHYLAGTYRGGDRSENVCQNFTNSSHFASSVRNIIEFAKK